MVENDLPWETKEYIQKIFVYDNCIVLSSYIQECAVSYAENAAHYVNVPFV